MGSNFIKMWLEGVIDRDVDEDEDNKANVEMF